jgi:glucose-1-phosphate thymidylyltransferase
MTTRAVILARGLGTRMRQPTPGAVLDPAQEAAAAGGLKAFIPIGRPFLDYVISGLADAGLTRICLVIGPEHGVVARYYQHEVPLSRVTVDIAIQAEARGTADAVLSAESWAAGDPFLVLNADNYYPVGALAELSRLTLPGLIAFDRNGLLADGLIPPERLLRFALLDLDGGRLRRIAEKPDAIDAARFERSPWISMNCWRFDDRIFDVCRAVPVSPRGELELPLAVQMAIDDGRFPLEAVFSDESVLDLSGRADIAGVAARLAGVPVYL